LLSFGYNIVGALQMNSQGVTASTRDNTVRMHALGFNTNTGRGENIVFRAGGDGEIKTIKAFR